MKLWRIFDHKYANFRKILWQFYDLKLWNFRLRLFQQNVNINKTQMAHLPALVSSEKEKKEVTHM